MYRKTQENFNTAMAMAGKIVIAEVDEIVPIGELKPEEIKTQHLFVDYLVKTNYEVEGGTFVERTK
ncbi:CoA-transferase [Geomicrobium sp. JCM 19038]|uniref:CoA-transferase n=1 Tax=Geomicrobium sp. JCM 19038 TaxID=1460635 RepID=UPI00268C6E77|nr:CoA-transferase [Geomicrobium sp. JCM 19038]